MKSIRVFIQLLLFLATFVLEVRVRAEAAHDAHPAPHEAKSQAHSSGHESPVLIVQQEPANCLKGKLACAVRTREGQTFELVLDEKTTVVLDFLSSIIRISNKEIRLVSGSVWIKSQGDFQVHSEFGDVVSTTPGEFWVTRTKERVTAKATEATVELRPRGSKENLTVDPGLQNTIGLIGLDGKAETGIPLAIPFKEHLNQWARVYRGPKKTFEEQVQAFHERWTSAAVESAVINKAIHDRMISSADEEKAVEDAREAKVRAQREADRKFFRSRVFDGL